MAATKRVVRSSLIASWQQLARNTSKMAFASGLRAAVVVCGPLLLSPWIGASGAAWMSLGGIETSISDPGGPYRRRLQTMAVLTLGGTVGTFIGTLAAVNIWTALITIAAWGFLWGLLRSLSEIAAPTSALNVVIFLCALGQSQPKLDEAVHRALLLCIGCVLSLGLAMGLWPFRPYAPVRKAVAEVYRALGDFISDATKLSLQSSEGHAEWHRMGQQYQNDIRVRIERARVALAEARSGRAAETRRGEQLTVLVESSDLLFGWYIGLADLLEELSAGKAELLPVLRLAIRHTGEVCFWVEDAVRSENAKLMGRFPQMMDGLSAVADIFESDSAAVRSSRLLRSLVDALRATGETTRALLTGQASMGPALTSLVVTAESRNWLENWRERFVTDRNVFRYAGRLAIVPPLAHGIGALFGVNHSYWLTFTAVIVMQPTMADTFKRGLQRVEGTVLGGIVAAVLASVIHTQLQLAAVLFPLAVMTLATLPLHYGAFAFFLTPTFVLLSLSHFGDWHLAGVRIVDTLGGSLLGLLGALLLWPTWERERFTAIMAACLRVNCNYLLLVERALGNPGAVTPAEWVTARRAAGLANNRADESLSRLLSEPKASGSLGEAAMAFVTYMRRLAQYGTAVVTASGLGAEKSDAAVHMERVSRGLLRLADGLESGAGVDGMDESGDCVSPLERQSVILHRSARKMMEVLKGT